MPTPAAYRTQLDDWRKRRLADLLADDGWLNLTDRVEVTPGIWSVGSSAGNNVVLSVGPAQLGKLIVSDQGKGQFQPKGETSAPLPFQPTVEASPQLRTGGLLLELTSLEGTHALRVRNLDPTTRRKFPGLTHFPVDPDWRIRAEWLELATPVTFQIGMVNGVSTHVTLTHKAVFRHQGAEYGLLPTHQKSGKRMFVIRDLTSQDMTYAASRFLYGEDEGHGTITLDFNKAFNPPCAFTDLAICPLPPRENILPFRIEAGELAP